MHIIQSYLELISWLLVCWYDYRTGIHVSDASSLIYKVRTCTYTIIAKDNKSGLRRKHSRQCYSVYIENKRRFG